MAEKLLGLYMNHVFTRAICCWLSICAISAAATVSGAITNRHGFGIGYAVLTATRAENTAVASNVTSRQGAYELELEEGSWTLELDPALLNEFGYQPLVHEMVISGTAPIVANMLALPIEPPIPPVLSLSVTGDRFSLNIRGGGDRVFQVERSVDATTWTNDYDDPYCTERGELSVGSNIYGKYSTGTFFRVVVLE
ncbi:MAG: hypothetical protein AB7V14_12810 [Kiritimatiellia bacterium]